MLPVPGCLSSKCICPKSSLLVQEAKLVQVWIQPAVVRHCNLFLSPEVREEAPSPIFWIFKATAVVSKAFYSSGVAFLFCFWSLFRRGNKIGEDQRKMRGNGTPSGV